MVTLQLEEVTLAYDHQVVLSGISLKAMPGELLGIIGPNGSGKTTLIKGISRLLSPRSGHIFINGQDVAAMSRDNLARLLAVVPQNPVLPQAFTAFEVVLMGRTPHLGLFRYESQKDMAIARQAMEMTYTYYLAQRRVGELSAGERQRVTIARALAQEPKLLLLDEPTANLDINYQIETIDLIKELCAQQGLVAVAALHDLNLAAQYCDRLVMLSNGRVYAEGRPISVITAQNIREVYGAKVCVFPHPLNDLPATLVMPGGSEEKTTRF